MIYSMPSLYGLLENPSQPKLIIRGDAAKIGGKQCLVFVATLRNFGKLCNRTRFQFIIGAGYTTDKEQDNLAFILGKGLPISEGNFHLIQTAISRCTVFLIYICLYVGYIIIGGKKYTVDVKFSGDKCFFRVFLGLESSKSLYFCWKCCDVRDAPSVGNLRLCDKRDVGVTFYF